MAAPTIETLPSLESFCFPALDEHLARWSSSSSSSTSYSESSSASRSASYAGCPTMSKSLTDSMSSDTQTENETPPESPGEDVQTTPIIRATPSIDYPRRPALSAVLSHISIYSESDDAGSPDAGYETECDDKRVRAPGPFARRRVHVDRRRGEHRPASAAHTRFVSSTPPPTAPHPAAAPPTRPPKIALPPPTFPAPRARAPIGLGLGLGLPSTLSAVRRAPNCAHRASTDTVPPLSAPASLFSPFPPVPPAPAPLPPTKPRLAPVSPPGAMSPLSLSPLSLDAAPPQPRHAAFCFAHGGQVALANGAHGMTAAALLTLANQAQARHLQSAPEEEDDSARGIRRFPSMNPYFPAMGYCVTSG